MKFIHVGFSLLLVFSFHQASAEPVRDDSLKRLKLGVDDLGVRILQGKVRNVSSDTVVTLRAYLSDAKRASAQNAAYTRRMTKKIDDHLVAAEEDRDLLSEKRDLFWRGYKSDFTSVKQLYSIYVPKTYDTKKPMPLIVTLHGGSSNHNVWLAKVLGNIISVADYRANFRTEFKAQIHPDAIVVAPDGLGQIRWRWMGEQDVFDVIEDVRRNYNIDPDRIYLSGLSNGGIGAYTIGLKYAWRFAAVMPLSGVTHWPSHLQSESSLRPAERAVLENESALAYALNAFNTHFRFYHGLRDPGFKVQQARLMAKRLSKLGVPFFYKEFEGLGHDLGHILWRDLSIMKIVREHTRKSQPKEVRLAAASERANRQFWLVLDNRANHTIPATVSARVDASSLIEIETENARRLSVLLDECPVRSPIRVRIDGAEVYNGPIPPEKRITWQRDGQGSKWNRWDGKLPPGGSRKVAGLSGPLVDANYEPQCHVYGSQVPADIAPLRKAADLGARAWMMGKDYSEVRQPVLRDTELTEEMMKRRVVVLYGNAQNNSILKRIGDRLPIKVGPDYIEIRGKKLYEPSVGARFVCPNPLVLDRYLVVKAGNSAGAVVQGAQQLPLYLPDYIVHDKATIKVKASMALQRRPEIETGFFTEDWSLPERSPQVSGARKK